MARTFPDDLPAAPASERVVFGALKARLPDPWQVWHGVAYSAAQTGATAGKAHFFRTGIRFINSAIAASPSSRCAASFRNSWRDPSIRCTETFFTPIPL